MGRFGAVDADGRVLVSVESPSMDDLTLTVEPTDDGLTAWIRHADRGGVGYGMNVEAREPVELRPIPTCPACGS